MEERKHHKYMFAINHEHRVSERKSNATVSDDDRTRAASSNKEPEEDNDFLDSDEEDSDDGSVLSEISDENLYFEKKLIYQRRALFRKNMTLQWRQRWTNIWQLISPIMGLLIVVVFKELGIVNMLKFSDKAIFVPFPQLFGLQMKSLSAALGEFLEVNTCDQWYMYEFDKSIKPEDVSFFGFNEGEPWYKLNSSGMLDGKQNVLTYTCNEINKTVPYFKEFKTEKYDGTTDMGEYLANVIRSFASVTLDFVDREA